MRQDDFFSQTTINEKFGSTWKKLFCFYPLKCTSTPIFNVNPILPLNSFEKTLIILKLSIFKISKMTTHVVLSISKVSEWIFIPKVLLGAEKWVSIFVFYLLYLKVFLEVHSICGSRGISRAVPTKFGGSAL